jgi:peptide chain release factor 1
MATNMILERLEGVKTRFVEVGELLTQQDVLSNMEKYIRLNKEYKELQPIIEAYEKYKLTLKNIDSAKELLATEKDEEMREMAKEELEKLNDSIPGMEEEIKLLLIPADPEDEKGAVMEIRAGTGGDEASIFAGDLFRMYMKFFEEKGWKAEVNSYTEGTAGGYKEIVLSVSGDGVYGLLKYESGVHRVQRVPQTETQGRIHTSAASVVVLPEAGEFDIEIKSDDIRKDTYCSSGPGGQSVNTTYSAIRLTHIPTGIVVTCQDEKSQIKNYDKALKELRTRLYNLEYQKYLDDVSHKRKTMVSTGDRSAKIRTYNYPQGRMTDHRINLTLYNLDSILDGNIQEVIDKLQMAENAERLKESNLKTV